jgi:hypothetical protein
MIVRQYGIVLRRLQESDLEMVRTHRNRPEIQKGMFYQDYITSEQQKKWFKDINNYNNFYFIVERDGVPLGLINGRDVDYEAGTSEGGIFLWGTPDQIDDLAFLSSVIILELTFMLLKLKVTYARIRADNRTQLKYNRFFGFEIKELQDSPDEVQLELDAATYLTKRPQLLKYAEMLSGHQSNLSWESLELSAEDEAFAKAMGFIP